MNRDDFNREDRDPRRGDSLIARADEDRIRDVMPDAAFDRKGERLGRVAEGSGEDRAIRDGWRAEERQRDSWAFAQPPGPGDAGIRDAIARRLAYDACVDEGDIILSVQDGMASLEGLVNDDLARQRAGEIVAAVDGVRGVRNDLAVRNISAAVPLPGTMEALDGDPGTGRMG